MPFALKKFISQFLMPMPLVCECFLLGCILTYFTRYKKTGKCFYLLGVTLFLAFGYGFGRTYLYNLERRYPPFDPTPEQCESFRGTPIVVLGQGMPEKSDLPVRYQNNPVFERRLFEGVRVAKLIPDSYLIVSMAGDASNSVKQAALDDYMQRLNFPTNRVAMFTTARDTSEEAKLVKNCLIALLRYCVIGTLNQTNEQCLISKYVSTTNALASSNSVNFRTNCLILSTSASHMPRAMKIFQKLGLNPIPAPCDFTSFEEPQIKWENWYQWSLPNGENIGHSERALYEWLGNLYERTF
jgi:uncharacterized SAM-binding protein YcdF (DUF218 family)